MNKKCLIVIVGPTAIGKTDLAIQIAMQYNTEIISADSRQIYKELHIGTASPSIEQLGHVKHHFIKSISVMDYYNAGMFESEVMDSLTGLFKLYDMVVMTGGSTLYIDAVINGIDDLPETDMVIRNDLNQQYKIQGIEYLQHQLEKVDPDHYRRVDLKNPFRLMKAIEISIMTGKPYSSLLTNTRKKRDFDIVGIGLNRDRQDLYKTINSRVDKMITDGLADEVKSLGYARTTNALQTVGYREIFEYLDGKVSIDEATEKIKTNTRRYAKRQITWFSRYHDFKWFNPSEYNKITEYIQSNT